MAVALLWAEAMRTIVVAVLLVLMSGISAEADLSGADIIQRMQLRRVQGDDAVSVLDVALVAPDGARTTRTVATYRKRCGEEWRNLRRRITSWLKWTCHSASIFLFGR